MRTCGDGGRLMDGCRGAWSPRIHEVNNIGIETWKGIGWERSSDLENGSEASCSAAARSRYDMGWPGHGRSLALREYHESSDELHLPAGSLASIDPELARCLSDNGKRVSK